MKDDEKRKRKKSCEGGMRTNRLHLIIVKSLQKYKVENLRFFRKDGEKEEELIPSRVSRKKKYDIRKSKSTPGFLKKMH